MYKYKLQDIRLYIFILLIIIVSCTSKLEDKIKLLEQSHNDHKIDRVTSLYTDDAKFVLIDGWVAEGKDNLIERFNWDFAVNGSLKFLDLKTIKDTVICEVEERNDFFRMLNIDVVKYDYTKFIFKEDLIKEVQAKLSQNSNDLIEDSFSSFVFWASSERPGELDSLKSNGNFTFTKENSKKWLELLIVYRDNSKSDKN
jgi:hypothetical protein